MSQDDPQQSERSTSSAISRDTWLLLGALTFLILAVALTFLFTPTTDEQASATATSAGVASVPSTETVAPTSGSYPEPTAPTRVTDGVSPYPSPASEPTSSGDPNEPREPGYPSPGAEPSPSPDFSVSGSPSALLTPTEAFGEPYPAPDGTPPAQATFNPTVVVPTIPQIPNPTTPLNTSGQPQQPASATPEPPTLPPDTPEPPTPTDPITDPVTDPIVDNPTPTTQPTPETPKEPLPEPTELPAAPPVAPAAPPAEVLRGNVRWAAGQSPIILTRDVQIAPGAELIIEPGVEVRLNPGVSIYVDGGRMLALGLPDRMVRFTGNTGARWSGIYGNPTSFVVMENTEVRGGGVGGTVIAIERGEFIMRSSRVFDNGGAILLTDTKLEMRNSEVAGNDMPYGAALDATYSRGNFVTLQDNRIGGNILSAGAPLVRVTNQSTFDTLNLEISGNLFRGGEPNLQLATNGYLKGNVRCNAMVGDGLGFGLRTQTIQVGPNGTYTFDLRVDHNFIDEHIPPIIPVYLKYGLGRGATSEIQLDMRNNWWGAPSGPYEPDANEQGRGDSVGSNITFAPWLSAPPSCAPNK